MMLEKVRRWRGLVLLGWLVACGTTSSSTSSETNWLSPCESNQDCSGGTCLCGLCSKPCDEDSACDGLEGAACAAANGAAAEAQCGSAPSGGLCLRECSNDQGCGAGQHCLAGSCVADAGAGGSSGSGGSGGAGFEHCNNPEQQCVPDCDGYECGSLNSQFDSNGCLRERCTNDDGCASNEHCLTQLGEGGEGGQLVCAGPWFCEPDENGICVCGGGASCWGYCVPR